MFITSIFVCSEHHSSHSALFNACRYLTLDSADKSKKKCRHFFKKRWRQMNNFAVILSLQWCDHSSQQSNAKPLNPNTAQHEAEDLIKLYCFSYTATEYNFHPHCVWCSTLGQISIDRTTARVRECSYSIPISNVLFYFTVTQQRVFNHSGVDFISPLVN